MKVLLIIAFMFPMPLFGQDTLSVIPKDVKLYLNENYQAWSFAGSKTENFAQADFDGDEQPDYALCISHADQASNGSQEHELIVLMNSTNGLKQKFSTGCGGIVNFGIGPKGERGWLVHTDTYYRFENDVLYVGYGEKASSIYIFYGGAFLPIPNGD